MPAARRSAADRPWLVMKFGGTSVASLARWRQIDALVAERLREHRVIVVASAVAGVTNLLEAALHEAPADGGARALGELRARHEALADELGLDELARGPAREPLASVAGWLEGIRLTGEAPPRLQARVLATGELLSTRLGAAALAAWGRPVKWIDARTLLASAARPGLSDERRFLEARVEPREDRAAVDAAADGAELFVTQGFIARTPHGETCLLGRGGSDTSAALLAALAAARQCEIWTDVPGMFTADPRLLPTARLIRRLGFREAQELAALGGKVLHPRCLEPVRRFRIPLAVWSTERPELAGTRVEPWQEDHPAVTAVTHRQGVTLVTVSTLAMWEASGFLARVFEPFAQLDLSIDLVGTSQSAVSVTLDRVPGGLDGSQFAAVIEALGRLGRVEVVSPCAVVSVVGRRIRAVLHELGPALEVLQERRVHLVSNSSEDLNLSFVVDEPDGPQLVARLHDRLFSPQGDDARLGPTWEKLAEEALSAEATELRGSHDAWWRAERERLLALVADGRARYVYHLPTVRERARGLRAALPSIGRFFYSMKANPHPALLGTVVAEGFGLECVSAEEVAHARRHAGSSVPLLFTPSYCPLEDYRLAFEAAAEVTLDGTHLFELAPDTFRGTRVALRIDPGRGRGHHPHVQTAGAHAKFGLPLGEAAAFAEAAARAGVEVIGLHAHVGSGILEPATWAEVGDALAPLVIGTGAPFPRARWIDLGGGLGVADRPAVAPLDLRALEALLAPLAARLGEATELRLEPGRYLVSEAGVLLAPVTQVRRRAGVNFAGVATGMNSLLRPALYGAWHPIWNLSRLDEKPADYWHVVGPICESSDVLGRDRRLPDPRPGDVLLIANAGAYGHVMASRYNLREPAEELVLD